MSIRGDSSSPSGIRRLGGLLILLGVFFAFSWRLWPLVPAIMAVGFLGIFRKRRRAELFYLACGVYLLCFSVLALYCNFTSWSCLATLWPLFITFLGFVFLAATAAVPRHRRVFLVLGLLLVSLSALFFCVLGLGTRYWWTVLVLAGLSVLAAERVE